MWRGCWCFLLPYRTGCIYKLAITCACSRARNKFTPCIGREEQHRVLDAILHFFHSLYNPEGLKELIRSGGAPLICAIVFIETGFFVGFFLPGDSLLVTAGIFSAARVIPLKWLLFGPFGPEYWRAHPLRHCRYCRALCPARGHQHPSCQA